MKIAIWYYENVFPLFNTIIQTNIFIVFSANDIFLSVYVKNKNQENLLIKKETEIHQIY